MNLVIRGVSEKVLSVMLKGLEIKNLRNYRSTDFVSSHNTITLPHKPKSSNRYLK